MGKRYIWQRKIDYWLCAKKIYTSHITKGVVAKILGIDSNLIKDISIRNRCINVFTSDYLYKFQLYGDNIKIDLKNRNRFSYYMLPLMSPIKVYKRIPLTIMMPILERPIDNEEMACYILNRLKVVGHETVFKLNNYPFIMDGLNTLRNCRYVSGRRIGEELQKYLQKREGIMVRAGIVHGDFHRDNIMCKGNIPVLIDFDCFRENDVQAIDALYYILEEVRHKNGYKKPWLEEWLLTYENIDMVYNYKCIEYVDIDFKFGFIILLLERISQDQRYDYLFIQSNERIVKKIKQKLIKELKSLMNTR